MLFFLILITDVFLNSNHSFFIYTYMYGFNFWSLCSLNQISTFPLFCIRTRYVKQYADDDL
uniref:Uncharacterized protein n=1 Tax=Anguilla anguilla TaxID=7936 RepID=A0A0E9UNN7_ANGAN